MDMNKNPHRPGRPRKELSKEMVVALLTMYETKSTRQIAEELQVSQATICKWLKRAKEQQEEQTQYEQRTERQNRYHGGGIPKRAERCTEAN